MGRKDNNLSGTGTLSVKIPSFFRCPISLDIMKSPVSLCTGVTYDRSSIQRWLDSGNNTCPATMLPLTSTDLVPNLTLHRLISLWSDATSKLRTSLSLISDLRSADPSSSLRNLADFFSDDEADDVEKNQLISAAGCADLIAGFISDPPSLNVLEAAAGAAAVILLSSRIEKQNKEILAAAVAKKMQASISSLVTVLKQGRSVGNAAVVIDALIVHIPSSKTEIGGNDDLMDLLVKLAAENEFILSCLIRLSGVKKARLRMVRLGIVRSVTKILLCDEERTAAAEKAIKLLEAVSACREGREAICEEAEATIPAVMRRMMKVGREGAEAAVVVLWSVCHLFKDRRAQEAAAASNGGLTRILLLMQSDCSPTVRMMSGDLLKMFRVNSKCCLNGYESKATHIMPF